MSVKNDNWVIGKRELERYTENEKLKVDPMIVYLSVVLVVVKLFVLPVKEEDKNNQI